MHKLFGAGRGMADSVLLHSSMLGIYSCACFRSTEPLVRFAHYWVLGRLSRHNGPTSSPNGEPAEPWCGTCPTIGTLCTLVYYA